MPAFDRPLAVGEQLTTPREAIRLIIAEEAERAGIGVDELLGSRRLRAIVCARYAAMRRIHRAYPHKSYPEIGRIFGRHHATVMYALGASRRKSPR